MKLPLLLGTGQVARFLVLGLQSMKKVDRT
jgi:hypothetical protein